MSSNADIYHEMIIDYSRNPINYGKIENPDVTFHDSNPLCGDSIDIDMKINDNKISDIKFHGKGCAICMACSSVLTEISKGKTIDEVRNITKHDVLSELGLEHLQAVRIKCALLSLKVLKSALYSYLGKNMIDSQDADKLKEEASSLY
ncbi:MAG: iron-sulfur cluster assembly scaffold protein [Nitrosarchaeum sp.]|jgi:nitrogen fixation NifU-like protein|nr:iron-sulfur cluster assembly scaffold protein [Nitrosarchaeum sp.]MBP0120671.1 iron-sulfur cluster assembly scaffold protein [Nitrosarchaeum sp.]MBP0134201.1 iron-sulfur cluster assembly scaffold protein [Nitrosarchaeum sp.]MSV26086.1 iron-sulfur cluster assembly scaffold protein [Nitrosarchaeum sp.]PHY09410.1 MAG: Fe-S cluster protein [Nitrosarchaeum sp.]